MLHYIAILLPGGMILTYLMGIYKMVISQVIVAYLCFIHRVLLRKWPYQRPRPIYAPGTGPGYHASQSRWPYPQLCSVLIPAGIEQDWILKGRAQKSRIYCFVLTSTSTSKPAITPTLPDIWLSYPANIYARITGPGDISQVWLPWSQEARGNNHISLISLCWPAYRR